MDLFNMFGGYQNFQQRFRQFAENFNRQSQLTPQQRVQQLLDSGQRKLGSSSLSSLSFFIMEVNNVHR